MNPPSLFAKGPKKIALFANHQAGLRVAQFLQSQSEPDQIVALSLCDLNPEVDNLILDVCRLEPECVFIGYQDFSQPDVFQRFSSLQPDVIICVYWPWLLPASIYSECDLTINFHPALLPANRGWYPHVHNIINGDLAGVTLHELAPEADSGAIWAQKIVDVLSTDTADTLYYRLQEEIVSLFERKWPLIRDGMVNPIPQCESSVTPTYNKKNILKQLDAIKLDEPTTARHVINVLRARTFGARGFAHYEDDQGLVYVRIELSRSSAFEDA